MPVVVAHAGVVAPHDEVGAAVVLPHDGVEDGLPGAGVAHGRRQHGEMDAVLGEVAVEQYLVTGHTHVSGDVVVLRIADEGMDEGAVDAFQRDLDEVLVGAMDGVPRLEANDRPPAALGEDGARLRGGEAVVGEVPVVGQAEGLHRAADHEVAGGVEGGDAGVGLVGRAVDLLGQAGLVAPVDLVDLDDAEGEALPIA